MDPTLEIRKLLPSQIKELVIILETHELWKRLMSIIPKKLERDFICDISFHNHAKYHSEHFRLIENASDKTKKPCTEILFDEWGTSGRIRPTLGHLLYLLTKAKLFRAADYVAVNLLNQERPERPEVGPEARIPIDLPSCITNRIEDPTEELLNSIDYPSQAINIIRTNSAKSRKKTPPPIPQIIITPEEDRPCPNFANRLVVQRRSITENQSVSDMIKFSNNSPENTDYQPAFSQLIHTNILHDAQNISHTSNSTSNNSSTVSSYNGSALSDSNNVTNGYGSSVESEIRPAFSELIASNTNNNISEQNIPKISALNITIASDSGNALQSNSDMLPNFEEIMKSDSEVVPSLSSSGSHPDFNILMSGIENKHKKKSSWTSLSSESRSRSCTSPLPNLSLNTILPHFTYAELEIVTNNFNSEKFKDEKEPGRLLGSGAFGSVYLGLGLLNIPVAVKKLVLENVEVVNVDDIVTKQFRNEVEVLSKYKHENLLSLIGYSCDGCTYCLLYEYVSGGALKDRLQLTASPLQWKQRIEISVGTARAVSYLHTAFSTPLIHRDIKSANILLDFQNKPKLCDFGLIKLSPTQHTSTATTVFGTSAYMAPEAFRGDISVRLDTFSFGVVLLELLTSLPPMDESREGADLVTHIVENCENDDISPVLDRTAGDWCQNDQNYAEEMFRIALKCLEEKKKRPNMVEVTDMLNKLEQSLGANS